MKEEILTLTTARQELKEVRNELRMLKGLEADYRDIEPGSPHWVMFLKRFPKKRAEAEAWINGPILYFHPLNETEQRVLGTTHNFVRSRINPDDEKDYRLKYWLLFTGLIREATEGNCSYIYIKNETAAFVQHLNTILRHFNLPMRFKYELDVRSGKG